MPGWMSTPSLGFNSTVGAFIGGAARGANEDMQAAADQEYSDKKIAQMQALKADGMNAQRMKENKQNQQDADTLGVLQKYAGGDPSLASEGMTMLRNHVDMNTVLLHLQQNAGKGGSQGQTPNAQPQGTPQTTPTIPQTADTGQTPDNTGGDNVSSPNPTGPANTDVAPPSNYPQITPQAPQDNSTGQQFAPGPYGKALPPQKPPTAHEQHMEQNSDTELRMKQDDAKNKLTPLETEFSKQIGSEDPTKGAYSLGTVGTYNDIARDANLAVTMLTQGGMKTSALQPLYDSVGRLAQAVGIPELQGAQISNNVQMYNELQKIQSRLQFGEISKYHLGRWTQMEVGMLGKQVLNGANDASTNVKLALLIGKTAENARDDIIGIRSAAGHGDKASIDKAMDLRDHTGDKYLKDNALPWTQATPDNFNQISKNAPANSWIENTTNGQIYQVISNDGKGNIQLKKPGGQ
jgi:hypothetical protein